MQLPPTQPEEFRALLTSEDGLAMSEDEAVRYAKALQQLADALSMICREMMVEFHRLRRESYYDSSQNPDYWGG